MVLGHVLAMGEKRSWKQTDVSVVVEQCCTEPKMFQLFISSCQQRGGVHKELGGNRTRAFDPNGQRDISCYMILCKKKPIFTLLTTSCAHTLRFEEGRMTYREQTASMWCQSNMFIGRPLSRIRILETGWRHHANILMCFSTSMWFTTTVSVYGYFLRVLGVV